MTSPTTRTSRRNSNEAPSNALARFEQFLDRVLRRMPPFYLEISAAPSGKLAETSSWRCKAKTPNPNPQTLNSAGGLAETSSWRCRAKTPKPNPQTLNSAGRLAEQAAGAAGLYRGLPQHFGGVRHIYAGRGPFPCAAPPPPSKGWASQTATPRLKSSGVSILHPAPPRQIKKPVLCAI